MVDMSSGISDIHGIFLKAQYTELLNVSDEDVKTCNTQ